MAPMVMRFGYSDFDILMSSLSAISPPKLEEDQSFVSSPREPTSPLVGVDEEKMLEEGGDTASDSDSREEGMAMPSDKQREMDSDCVKNKRRRKMQYCLIWERW